MDILYTLWDLVQVLFQLVVDVLAFALRNGVWIAWFAWWLFGVDWKKAWPVLARGAWMPVLLLAVVAALVWSQISPRSCDCLGVAVPNFWWQLGAVGLLASATLFCGWLQLLMNYTPEEVSFEPPAESDAAGHGHH